MEGCDHGLIKVLPRHLLGLNEKKITRKISVGGPEWGSNRAPPEYKAEALLADNLLSGSMMDEA